MEAAAAKCWPVRASLFARAIEPPWPAGAARFAAVIGRRSRAVLLLPPPRPKPKATTQLAGAAADPLAEAVCDKSRAVLSRGSAGALLRQSAQIERM